MDLKHVTTKKLSKKLESRLGVQSISLQLEEPAKITVRDQRVLSFDGPAVIIVNMD